MIAQIAFIAAIIAITISALIIVSCCLDPIDQASDNRANRDRLADVSPFHKRSNSL